MLAGAHEHFVGKGFQGGKAFQPAAEDLFDMLHALEVCLFHRARQDRLLLAQEGMDGFFYQMHDTAEPSDLAEGIVVFNFKQLFQHRTMREANEHRVISRTVLPGKERQFVKEFSRQILRCQFMRAEYEQPLDDAAGGEPETGAVAGICEKDVVPEVLLIRHDGLPMADRRFFLRFYLVEGYQKTLCSGFAVKFQIAIQPEIHHGIREMPVYVLRKDSTFA